MEAIEHAPTTLKSALLCSVDPLATAPAPSSCSLHLVRSMLYLESVCRRITAVVVSCSCGCSTRLFICDNRRDGRVMGWQADLKNRELALECGINTQYLVARVQGDQRKEGERD